MQTSSPLRAVDDLPPDVPATEGLPSGPASGPVKKLLFRFAFGYLVLYNFPFPLSDLPSVQTGYLRIWRPLVRWVGRNAFGVTLTRQSGGDSTYSYVQVFCFLVISLAAALVWTLLDRKRRDYARLYEGLRVYVRFVLAVTLVVYGASKVFPSQFLAPTTDRLMQPYGDSSPLGLYWTFLGASVPYGVFTGLGELAGGLLLTLRRTTLFGALVGIGVLSNAVMLNLGYDGSAKLFSVHLLLMAAFLAARDLRRLTQVLVLNRPAEPEEIRPLFRRKGLARTAAAVAAVFVLYRTGASLYGSYREMVEHGPKAASGVPLRGMWNVEELMVDGEVRPPLVTEERRWRRLFFSTPGLLAIQLMSGSRERFDLDLDEKQGRLVLHRRDDPDGKTTLVYQRPQPDVLLVAGPFEGHQVRARLRLTEPPKFLLVTRGFHWVSDGAGNR
jgi:uncharacterized membrane protein YphA (DoxX/SURF4 family)